MGLGDDLVTIRVLEHPGGPTLWPLGLCSPCHGPPKSFKIAVCRWFNGIWCEHKPLTQFSTLYKSKMENFAKHFFDIVTTYNDEICYVKHVLAPFYVFFTLFGCGGGGGAPKGSRAQLAYAIFPPQQLKNGNFLKLIFFDTLTIQNDQISHVKHVLAPSYAFFTLFGCCGWGGSQGVQGTTCLCSFPPSAAQKWKFPKPVFLIF